MKFDPCIPYLTSLLILVACATTAVVTLVLGTFTALIESTGFLVIVGAALLMLLASWRALGEPLEAQQEDALPFDAVKELLLLARNRAS